MRLRRPWLEEQSLLKAGQGFLLPAGGFKGHAEVRMVSCRVWIQCQGTPNGIESYLVMALLVRDHPQQVVCVGEPWLILKNLLIKMLGLAQVACMVMLQSDGEGFRNRGQ